MKECSETMKQQQKNAVLLMKQQQKNAVLSMKECSVINKRMQ